MSQKNPNIKRYLAAPFFASVIVTALIVEPLFAQEKLSQDAIESPEVITKVVQSIH